jgi:hypothetical protein
MLQGNMFGDSGGNLSGFRQLIFGSFLELWESFWRELFDGWEGVRWGS